MTLKEFQDLEVVILEDWLMWADGVPDGQRLQYIKDWFKEYQKGNIDVPTRTDSQRSDEVSCTR